MKMRAGRWRDSAWNAALQACRAHEGRDGMFLPACVVERNKRRDLPARVSAGCVGVLLILLAPWGIKAQSPATSAIPPTPPTSEAPSAPAVPTISALPAAAVAPTALATPAIPAVAATPATLQPPAPPPASAVPTPPAIFTPPAIPAAPATTSVAAPPVAHAKGKAKRDSKSTGLGSDPATASLDAYLARVRRDNTAVQTTSGAIWTDSGRLTQMSSDVRAMRPHDLISVIVSENLAAEADGTVKNSRASNANSGISGLIGTLHSGNALQNLVNQTSASALNAQGASASNSSLTTTLGGQVVEVLPNGMLVIEAARQVEFAQQVQTIVLHGLVRPEDISQQNQVLSTAISSLEVQVRGKGIINDYTHRQNVLVRFLQNILVF